MPVAGSTRKAINSIMFAAWAWCAIPADIGNIVVGSQNGVPMRIRDIGEVTIGDAPRLGEFGFNKNG